MGLPQYHTNNYWVFFIIGENFLKKIESGGRGRQERQEVPLECLRMQGDKPGLVIDNSGPKIDCI